MNSPNNVPQLHIGQSELGERFFPWDSWHLIRCQARAMQLVVPRAVASAVRTEMIMFRIQRQVSFLFTSFIKKAIG